MTGAYAHDWPGWGARASRWDRGSEDRGRCGGYGRHEHGRHEHHAGRGSGFPLQELVGWAMALAKGEDPRENEPGGRGPGGRGPGGRGPGGRGRGRGRHGGPFGGRPTPEDLERLEELIALRRMRGRGPSPFGRGPRGRGRRRRGDVRLAILRLLAEEPRNGYQLMQVIEARSEGQWRPSPGSMYPTLSQLEDEGLIHSTEAESGRRFEITDAGRAQLDERTGEPDPWAPEPDADECAMTELGPQVIAIGKAAWQVASVGDEAQREHAVRLLAEARRGLYGILAEDPAEAADADADADAEQNPDSPEAPGESGGSEG